MKGCPKFAITNPTSMAHVLQQQDPASTKATTLPFEFLSVSLLAFLAALVATVHFCRGMCCELKMPGGWTLSMMWLRMPGQTWFASAINFLFMWLAMMVAMMLPSALPTFLKTHRLCTALCSMASGYFATWLAAGVGVYVFGVAFAQVAAQSEPFSRTVPWLLGVSLVFAGATQFTNWKLTHLLRCRSQSGCSETCLSSEGNFRLGCKQGIACCLCCAAPMAVMLVLGMMNPLVMIAVAIVIALEKLLPRPVIFVRLIGLSSILAGTISLGLTWLRST